MQILQNAVVASQSFADWDASGLSESAISTGFVTQRKSAGTRPIRFHGEQQILDDVQVALGSKELLSEAIAWTGTKIYGGRLVVGATEHQEHSLSGFYAPAPPKGRITGPVKLIAAVAQSWSLSDGELAALLGYRRATDVRDVLDGIRTFVGTEDQFDRARLIYNIHSLLARLFVDPSQESTWIRSPNSGLGDVSPLDRMLNQRIPGMVEVLRFVELVVSTPR